MAGLCWRSPPAHRGHRRWMRRREPSAPGWPRDPIELQAWIFQSGRNGRARNSRGPLMRNMITFKALGAAVMCTALMGQPVVAQQTQKGTLIFAVESLAAQTLDPILEGRPGNAVYQAAMYDSLVGFNIEKGGIGPGVAERWEIADD